MKRSASRGPLVWAIGRLRGIAVAAWPLLAGACAEPGAVPRTGPAEAVRLRVLAQPYLPYVALNVALDEGYFAEQGLEVELVPLPSSEASLPLLLAGSIDVAPANGGPGFFNAIARGEPIRAAAATSMQGEGCSFLALVARPGLQAEHAGKPGPLPVRRISLNRQAVMLWFADKALRFAGLEMDSLEVVDIPMSAEMEALRMGTVDAALAGEPFLSRTIRSGAAEMWVPGAAVMLEPAFSFVFFGRRVLEDEPDAGVRFLLAYRKAVRELAEGATQHNLAHVTAATGDDPAVLEGACWPFVEIDGRPDFAAVMELQEWLVGRGLLDRTMPAERWWTPAFIDRVAAIEAGVATERKDRRHE